MMFARIATSAARRASPALLNSARTFVTRAATHPRASHAALGVAVGAVAFGAVAGSTVFAEPPTKTIAGEKGGIERTFIAIKPDGVQRGLVAEIVSRFERKGYKLVAIKSVVPSKALAEKHYADLSARPFFKGLVDYMTSGRAPVIAMVWEGKDVVKQGRRIIGATNPLAAEPGTIRGDLCIAVGRNIIHGSDSFETATIEIGLWFKPEELALWTQQNDEWINSAN